MYKRSSGLASEFAPRAGIASSYRRLKRLRKMVKQAESLAHTADHLAPSSSTGGTNVKLNARHWL
jgi:hypothetical protein